MLFQIIAVLLLLAFYSCYFAKMLQQRKKNIKTDLLGKGKTGFVKAVELLLKVSSYAILIAEVYSIFFNKYHSPEWLRIVGVVIGTLGVTVFIVSVLEMRDSWRAGVPEKAETELVTTGIYRYSRNPAFLGFDLIYIGILCMFFNWLLFAITAFTAAMFHLQIVNVEEPFMVEAFSDEYLDYKKTVCRYIGRKQ